MKTFFFKSLPLLALMLAITASLAFTNSDESEIPTPVTIVSGTKVCYSVFFCPQVPQIVVDAQTPKICDTVDQENGPCTMYIPLVGIKQISLQSDCSVLLWNP